MDDPDQPTQKQRRAQQARIRAYLAHLEAEHGEIDPEVAEQVDREWNGLEDPPSSAN
jgi:hypothetical protein